MVRPIVEHRWWYLGLAGLFFVALLVRVWGLNAAGETWDEVAYFDAAKTYRENVEEQRWQDADAWIANREHPAIAKWLYAAASWRAHSADRTSFTGGRAFSALLGALTVVLTALIGARLYTRRVGLIAALILAFLPPWIALNRVLGLDSPTAFFFALTTWLFIEGLEQPKRSTWWWLAATVTLGLGIGTRLSNVLLLPFLAGVAVLYRWPAWKQGTRLGELAWAIPFAVIPLAIVYGTWPWLWHDTQAHWEITVGHWSSVSNTFLGVIQFPGWAYFLIYYLVSIPGLVVLLSLFFVARTLVRGTRSDWLVLAWIVAIFAFSAYGLRQGGIRYLAQAFPAFAIAAAIGFEQVLGLMKRTQTQQALIGLFAGYLVLHGLYYQPYQLDYYNEFTGGVATVAKYQTFQVGWWNEGAEEAVYWLNDHAPHGATLSYKVNPDRSQRLLRRDFVHTADFPDYIVFNPAASWQLSEWPTLSQYQLVYAVDLHGARLAEVWERVE